MSSTETARLLVLLAAGCAATPQNLGADSGADSVSVAAEAVENGGGAADVAEASEVTDAMGVTDSVGTAGASFAAIWVGSTSQQLPIRIAVDTAGVMAVEFGWQVKMCGSTTTLTFGAPVPIVDGNFMRAIPGGPGGVRGDISGHFASNTMLSGTLTFTVVPIPNVPSCSGSDTVTYTATPG